MSGVDTAVTPDRILYLPAALTTGSADPATRAQAVLLADRIGERVVVGFEDERRDGGNADDDFNDVVVLITADPPDATRENDDLAIPTDLVPGYRIVSEIGEGGQGAVYRALQEGTKREVAIKLLRADRFASDRQRARVARG